MAGLPRGPGLEDDAMTATTHQRHISCFIYALTGGGAQRRTIEIAGGLVARGHPVELVVVSGHGDFATELDPRVRLHVLDSAAIRFLHRRFDRRRVRGLLTAVSIPALARYLRQRRPDVLMSAANHVNLVAVLAHRLARVPTRLVLRTSNHTSGNLDVEPRLERLIRRVLRRIARHVYPWADAVIAVSDGVADDLADLTEIPRDSITTIYNPIVTARLREQQREELHHRWLGRETPVLLAVGTLKMQKDFPTLLRAFAEVRSRRPARLVILGDGAARGHLQRLSRHLAIDADVEFAGYVDNPYAWMSRASLLVLSSRWEGLPGVLIEAMACGCPVVSTDCPSGPAEILENGAWGPLVPVGDVHGLAIAIEWTLDHPPDRSRLRERANWFSVDRAISRYIEVLTPAADRSPQDVLR